MSDWTRCSEEENEDQQEVWNHDVYGSIVKVDGEYHALIPQTFVLGPFNDLNDAQRKVLMNYDVILNLARHFDSDMLKFIENLRVEENFKKELK
ncbi:MAG: hypothetical protein Q7K54_04995 [Candidatus Parcubacteria bacterium]|nr:hypothetical protein [Candidatus Parcubacteria bacterium]